MTVMLRSDQWRTRLLRQLAIAAALIVMPFIGQNRVDAQLFRRRQDAVGIGIDCPSGKKIYVHPISGDLQQCTQNLGFYNETSCPGGTVCERFPIQVPGYQDYCCWADDETASEKLIIAASTTDSSILKSRYTTPSTTTIDDIFNTEPPDEWITTDGVETSTSSSTTTSSTMTTSLTTRRRTFKKKTTTAPTDEPTTASERTTIALASSTTALPPHRRGPKCRNPDDYPLIDFGNRLRDCYYQQCPYGYRCEFAGDIMRYICCGKEREIFPPPGLPPLPEPRPLVPRPYPRRPGPYIENGGGGPYTDIIRDEQQALLQPAIASSSSSSPTLTCRHGNELTMGSKAIECQPGGAQQCPTTHPYCIRSAYALHHVCCNRVVV